MKNETSCFIVTTEICIDADTEEEAESLVSSIVENSVSSSEIIGFEIANIEEGPR